MKNAVTRVRNLFQGFLTGCLISAAPALWAETPPNWEYEGDLEERAEANAKVLAMEKTYGMDLDGALMALFQADLNRIYTDDPSLAAAAAFPLAQPGAFMAQVTEEVDAQLEAGVYQPWIDLQEELGEGEARRIFRSGFYLWLFELDPKYNPNALVERVELEWEGVTSASTNGMAGDGSRIHWLGSLNWYVFSLGWGDCPSGCIYRDYRIVQIKGDSREPVELALGDARELLEVMGVEAGQTFYGAPGDFLKAPSSAVLHLKSNPHAQANATVEWVRAGEVEDQWIRSGDELILTEDIESFRHGLRVELTHTDIYFIFEQQVHLLPDAPPFLRGERYPERWVKHQTGWINDAHVPWLYHQDHGWWWVQPAASDEVSWVIWEQGLGWTVLNLSWYPWIYSFGDNPGWLYYLAPTRNPRIFFDMTQGSWIEID